VQHAVIKTDAFANREKCVVTLALQTVSVLSIAVVEVDDL
jgi:hypothetical protein